MDFFDLHCDTASALMENGQGLEDNILHVSLKKAGAFGRWAQVFALFIHDKNGPEAAYALYEKQYESFRGQLAKHGDKIVQCRTGQDLENAFAAGKRAAILSVENGSALRGRLDTLERFQQDGVRLLTLTWFGENELGYGSMAGGPLKPFGRQVLEALPGHGILPDISHLSDEGVAEVCSLYSGPLVATHSNVRAQCGHCRNLTKSQITEIARRGGLIGINLCRAFLGGPKDNAEYASCEDVYRHLCAFLELGAAHTVCFGTDFDGASVPRDIGDIAGIPALYDYLLGRNLAQSLLQDVFFENACRFWQRVM